MKLDNLIQIGHNVQIGENTVSSAQTGIAGTSKVGHNCFLAGQVGIADHVTIGDRVCIGSKAVSTKTYLTEKYVSAIRRCPACNITAHRPSSRTCPTWHAA